MKIKKEYLILAIVIVALSVYLVMRRGDRTLYELPEMPKLSQKDITRLEITRGQTVIDLNKKDDNWYIAPKEYPANTDLVKGMLEGIEKLTLTALVSESKTYNLYDLTDDTRINVKAWQGDNLKRDIDVGKTASSFRHTFVKPAGNDRVYHARGNLRNTFETTVEDLRDKKVLTFAPADIQEIQIIKENQSLKLVRAQQPATDESTDADKKESNQPPKKSPVWQTPDGQSGDEADVNQILNKLSNLRCETFIEDREKEEFTSPSITIELKGPQQYNLSIFDKPEGEDSQHPATSSASKYAFLLRDTDSESIMKSVSSILKEPEKEEETAEADKPQSESAKE
ncbi:MAG: DUF4340 domain-containing protein [Desulfobacterales bacterium]|jgi:hypothetical protein